MLHHLGQRARVSVDVGIEFGLGRTDEQRVPSSGIARAKIEAAQDPALGERRRTGATGRSSSSTAS